MQEKGFFGSLFDIGFRSFVTTKIISVLFVISIILSALYVLGFVVAGFVSDEPAAGVVFLILSPIFFFLLVLYARVVLEFVVVVFRIYENTNIIAGQGSPGIAPRGQGGGSQVLPATAPTQGTPPQPPPPGDLQGPGRYGPGPQGP